MTLTLEMTEAEVRQVLAGHLTAAAGVGLVTAEQVVFTHSDDYESQIVTGIRVDLTTITKQEEQR